MLESLDWIKKRPPHACALQVVRHKVKFVKARVEVLSPSLLSSYTVSLRGFNCF